MAVGGAASVPGWWAGSSIAGSIIGGLTVKLLTTVAVSALSAALAPDPAQGGGITISATVRGEQNPETITVGRYATGGQAICPPYSHGPQNRYLTHVVELCSAPGAHLRRFMLGDQWVELGGEVDVPRSGFWKGIIDRGLALNEGDFGEVVSSGDYEGLVWVRYYDGTQTAADPMLLDRCGNHPDRPWTEDMVGSGICYAVITFKHDSERLTSVPRYRFELDGIPLYDIRKDSTAGGTGPQRLGNPATWAPSENPAVLAWNLMRGIRLPGGEIYGGNISDLRRLPAPVWITAMNRCDVPVDLEGGGTEPMYRAGLEIALDSPPAAALEEIFKACSATVADLGYGWGIVVGAPGLPVYAFGDEDIIVSRTQELDPFPGLQDTYDAVTAKFPDPEHLWETKEAPQRTNAAWEASDVFGRRSAALSLPAAPYAMQVQRLMRAWIEDERRFRRHVVSLPPDAAHVELTDTVDWTSIRNGYAGKDFSVHEIVEDPRSGIRQMSIRERDPLDYSWRPEFTLPWAPSAPPVTPPAPEQLSGFDARPIAQNGPDGLPRLAGIQLLWNADMRGRGLRWQIRRAGQTEVILRGSTQDVGAGALEIYDGILPNSGYQVRARLVAGRPTAWSGWITVNTGDARITRADLEQAVLDDLAKLEEWITDGVDDLAGELQALAQAIVDEAQARAASAAQLAQDLAAEAQARADAIAAEQQARIAEAREMAQDWCRLRDRTRAIAAEVLELANADHLAREEIRRSIAVQLGDLRAAYDQTITTIIGDNLAAAQRIEVLEVGSGALSAEIQRVDQGRVEATETTLASQAQAITDLQAGLDGKAEASALSALEATVSAQGDVLTAQGGSITALNSSLVGAIELAEGKGRVFTQDTAPPVAQRLPQNLWIDTTGGNNIPKRWIGGEWAPVRDKAATDALAQVATKAEASALATLSGIVSQHGDTISSQGSAITSLNNSLSETTALAEGKGRVFTQNAQPPAAQRLPQNLWIDTTSGHNIPKRWDGTTWAPVRDKAATDALAQVATKAEASALSALENTVSQQGGAITSQGSAITALQNTIGNPSTGLASKASSSALSALTSRVGSAEGALASQAETLTTLDARVGRMRAGGRFRVTTAATPTGADSRIGLHAEASDGETTHSAGLWLVAESSGTTGVTVAADRFAVVTGTGANAARRSPFIVRGNQVHMAELFVDRLSVADSAITQEETSWIAGDIIAPTTPVEVASLSYVVGRPGPQVILISIDSDTLPADGQGDTTGYARIHFRVIRTQNGSNTEIFFLEHSMKPGQPADSFGRGTLNAPFTIVDTANISGAVTYRVTIADTNNPNDFAYRRRFMRVLNVYK